MKLIFFDLQPAHLHVGHLDPGLIEARIKLSADDAWHLLRFRPGGETIVALVADLATKYGIALPDMPVEGMQADLTLAQRLAPVASSVGLIADRLSNTLGQARSETWQAATGNYSVLARVSAANPSLEKEMEPARAFFARRSKPQETAGGAASAK